MSDKNHKNRRRLLKTIAGAGGIYTAGKMLPETWTRPVVDAVSLPAHAQTSGVFFGVVGIEEITNAPPAGGGILDLIVPAAHAEDRPPREAHICVVPQGDEARFDVVIMNYFFRLFGTGVQFGGMVPIGGGKRVLDFIEGPENCTLEKSPKVEARLDSLAQGTLFVDGDEIDIPFNLPQQDCNLPGLGDCEDVF
ncbi:MAG: hypothetical protein U5R46_16385 [Gammaproteobacteria bacterium]|nr:hypothetical protein [Gammaproteobacteria bacterium]